MIPHLPSASNFSPAVDSLFKMLLVVSSVLVFLVWFGIIYFCAKYREGSKADREKAPTKARGLELSLSFVIFIFGLALFIGAAKVFYQMLIPPADSLEIDVLAKQWLWVFHDPRHGDQINSVQVPLGKDIRLVMTSEDVIHSFFIPAFRVKQDVLPGRYTSLWFRPTRLGSFPVLCSQYCGLSHSQMRAVIEVIPAEEYAKATPDLASLPEARGEKLYTQKSCMACHEGSQPAGPSLHALYRKKVALEKGFALADENYFRRSILQPQTDIVRGYKNLMPSFQGQLSEEELSDLIHYLKTK